MYDAHAMLGQQVHLLIVDPYDMGDDEVRAEDAQLVEVAYRGGAVQVDAVVDLTLGLRQVQVDLDVMLYSEAVAELQLRAAHRIDGMRPEGEGHAVAEPLEGLVVLVATLAIEGCTLRSTLVEEGVGEVGSEAELLDGACRLHGVHVHVEEAGRPRAEHLEAGELSPYIDVMLGHLGLHRPDVVLQPLH